MPPCLPAVEREREGQRHTGKRWSAAWGRAPYGEEGRAPPCLLSMEREREREWQRCMGDGAPHEQGGGSVRVLGRR